MRTRQGDGTQQQLPLRRLFDVPALDDAGNNGTGEHAIGKRHLEQM